MVIETQAAFRFNLEICAHERKIQHEKSFACTTSSMTYAFLRSINVTLQYPHTLYLQKKEKKTEQ